MNRKRVVFGLLAATVAAGLFVAPAPAQACDHPKHKRCGGYDYHDDDYDYHPKRRVRYYEDSYYVPRRRVYDDCDDYRPRYSRSYRCGRCSKRFSSSVDLSVHLRHSHRH